VHTGLDQAGRHQRRGSPDAAGGVHPEHRSPDGAERIRQEQLRHHDTFEHVRCLADHDCVDFPPGAIRVL
jgi:hypothetical protein